MSDEIWTDEDSRRALAQGWNLFEFHTSENGTEIQLQCWGDDPSERFANSGDAGVWEHVATQAAAEPPDPLCAKALRILQAFSPAEHRRIIKLAALMGIRIGARRL